MKGQTHYKANRLWKEVIRNLEKIIEMNETYWNHID